MNAMLLEKKIIFHSKNYNILGYIIEALSSFIFPFYWQHVYITLLPKQCKDFIYAPVPFIMGIESSLFEQNQFESSTDSDTIVVDLNSKKVSKIEMEPLPDTKNLRKQLSMILSNYKFNDSHPHEIDMAFPLVPNPKEIDSKKVVKKIFPKEEVRYSFFRYFAILFKEYRNFIVKAAHGATVEDLNEIFQKREEYLLKFPKKEQAFMKFFFETQAWERFLIQRIESTNTTEVLLFDEFIKQQTTKEKVVYLESKEFEIQKKITIKPASAVDLPKYSKFQYNVKNLKNLTKSHFQN
jgi:DENN domain-containing protein 4